MSPANACILPPGTSCDGIRHSTRRAGRSCESRNWLLRHSQWYECVPALFCSTLRSYSNCQPTDHFSTHFLYVLLTSTPTLSLAALRTETYLPYNLSIYSQQSHHGCCRGRLPGSSHYPLPAPRGFPHRWLRCRPSNQYLPHPPWIHPRAHSRILPPVRLLRPAGADAPRQHCDAQSTWCVF